MNTRLESVLPETIEYHAELNYSDFEHVIYRINTGSFHYLKKLLARAIKKAKMPPPNADERWIKKTRRLMNAVMASRDEDEMLLHFITAGEPRHYKVRKSDREYSGFIYSFRLACLYEFKKDERGMQYKMTLYTEPNTYFEEENNREIP